MPKLNSKPVIFTLGVLVGVIAASKLRQLPLVGKLPTV